MNILVLKTVEEKLGALDVSIQGALEKTIDKVPTSPARDRPVLSVHDTRRDKLGLSKPEGMGRMLHDIANIELQAMEIGFRSLIEYPEADANFREKLAGVVREEGLHLALCLEELKILGFQWGDWPINTGLWDATDASDSLLDRILIVHCYLEGSGLDAQEKLMRRLSGVNQKSVSSLMEKIFDDEKKHVRFGIEAYQMACLDLDLDPDVDFVQRAKHLFPRLPKRLESPSASLRKEVGFSDAQADVITYVHTKQRNRF